MRSMRFFLLAAWLCLSLGTYAQTTYFIAPPPAGNNDNNGSENAPWASISFALAQNQVTNGDIIQVQTGSYTEAQTVNVSKSVIITGLGGEVNLSSSSTPLINITASVVSIQGITLSPPVEPVDNNIGISIASPPGEEANITIRQNTISGFASGIAVNQVSNLTITNNLINNNVNGIIINALAFDNIIINENNLSGNTENALVNNSTTEIDASLNWWGGSDFDNVVDQFTGNADYNPWITDENDVGLDLETTFSNLGVKKLTAEDAVLQEAYDLIEEGGELSVYFTDGNNLDYEDLTVAKNITITGKAALFFDPNNSNIGLPRILSLTVNNSTLTIGGPLKVLADGLTLNEGNITITDNNTLYLSNLADDPTAQDGNIEGIITIDPFIPTADAPLSFLGVTIYEVNETLGEVSISRSTGIAARNIENSQIRSSIEVIWNIEVTNEAGLAGGKDIQLAWDISYETLAYEDKTSAVVWKREGDGEPWQQVGLFGTELLDENTRSVLVPDVTSFSQYTVAGINEPLPVELSHFSASLAEPHVELNWETASEINADFFSIERSENGKDFKEIGQLKAAGDSDTPLQYRYIDEQAARRFSGSLFYRLRTVDFDDSFEYSDITVVTISEEDIPMITAFARQGETSLKLFTRAIEPGDYRVWITDLSGRKIFERDMELVPKESYNLGIGNLPQSVYLIRCVGKQLALSTKFRIEEAD